CRNFRRELVGNQSGNDRNLYRVGTRFFAHEMTYTGLSLKLWDWTHTHIHAHTRPFAFRRIEVAGVKITTKSGRRIQTCICQINTVLKFSLEVSVSKGSAQIGNTPAVNRKFGLTTAVTLRFMAIWKTMMDWEFRLVSHSNGLPTADGRQGNFKLHRVGPHEG